MITQDTRPNYVWMWIGTNTTGKTPTAIKRAKAYKRSRLNQEIWCFDPRRSIREIKFIRPDNGREEKLIKKEHIIEQWQTDWADKLLGIETVYDEVKKKDIRKQVRPPKRDYLLILDDFQSLCPNYKTPQGLRDILAMRVEYNIDIIMVTHTPKFILEGVVDQVTDYSIFYNNARHTSFDDKIMNADKLKAAALIVNEYVTKFGRGAYPNFPYVHVVRDTGKVNYVNMDFNKLKQLDCFKYLRAA